MRFLGSKCARGLQGAVFILHCGTLLAKALRGSGARKGGVGFTFWVVRFSGTLGRGRERAQMLCSVLLRPVDGQRGLPCMCVFLRV
jgi:hypothetical protein